MLILKRVHSSDIISIMSTQLECRVVLRCGPHRFKMGMYDPLNGRYVPLGEHPNADKDKVVAGLRDAIIRAGHRLSFSETKDV
jgi:hypothetical protein